MHCLRAPHRETRRLRKERLLLACLLIFVLALGAGCAKSKPEMAQEAGEAPAAGSDDAAGADETAGAEKATDAAATESPSTDSPSVTPEQPDTSEPAVVEAPDEGDTAPDPESLADAAGETESEGETTAPSDDGESAEELEEPELPPQRILLLTAGGPLVIDVQVVIDGESHEAALQRLAKQALAAADEDQDGTPTWTELTNSERFKYGQFGNLAISNESERRQLIEQVDRNRDNIVDESELPRFFTRNAGKGRSFNLTSSNEFRGDNRSRSPIRRLLDEDRNGAITSAELKNARSRLLLFDANDDEILTPAEVDDDTNQMARQLSNQRRVRQPNTAIHVNEEKWAKLEDTLSQLYAYDMNVGPDDWSTKSELFESLDTDQDQMLSRSEMEGFATVKPHLVVKVSFGGDAEAGPQIELLETSAEIEADVFAIHKHQQRISIELSDTEVQLFVNEDPALRGFHDVARNQFENLDSDDNGYLDEEEFPENSPFGGIAFQGIDQNSDEQVVLEEVISAMDLRLTAFRSQVRARAADDRDAAFTALDTDGDGRLNSREIRGLADRMAAFDRNGDERVQSHEIPDSMVIGFVRGNPELGNLYAIPGGDDATATGDELPTWFLGMDANGDGELTAREFIGQPHHFREFDNNGDGFLSKAEAAEVE